jgi:hypothetical protein
VIKFWIRKTNRQKNEQTKVNSKAKKKENEVKKLRCLMCTERRLILLKMNK